MKRSLLLFFVFLQLKAFAQPCTPNTNSIDFNGSSDFISFPTTSLLNLTTEVSVEAWIYPTQFGFDAAQGSIICKHGWSSGEAGYVIRAGGAGELSFNIGGLYSTGNPASWQEVVSPPNSISLNTWTHVAGTFDGDSVNLYINGQLISTHLFSGTIVSSPTYDLKIGRLSDNIIGQVRYWTGGIDEARIWNRALTEAEIAANMNTQIDPAIQTGLIGYWRLNEGTGTSVSDLSASSISGIFNGSGWSTNVPFTTGVPPVSITAAGNTTFCDGGSVTLNANTGAGLNYFWSTGDTTQSITVTTGGTFTVTVTDANNCSAVSAPVSVTVNPGPPVPTITFNGTQLICSASSGLQWYLNGNTLFNQVGQNYTPLVNGSYTVIVTNINGCTAVSAPFIVNTLGIENTEGIQALDLYYNTKNQTCQLTYYLSKSSDLTISITDIQGRTIATLLNEYIHAGMHRFNFYGTPFKSGIYFIVLQNKTGFCLKKIAIIN